MRKSCDANLRNSITCDCSMFVWGTLPDAEGFQKLQILLSSCKCFPWRPPPPEREAKAVPRKIGR